MIHVKVTYTIQPAFLEQNQYNIARFLEDFRKLDASTFRYQVYLLADGCTFMHLSSYQNEAIQKTVLQVPSFLRFQQERDASGLNNSHQVEVLRAVGASFDT